MLGSYLAWTVADSRGLGLGPFMGFAIAITGMFIIGMVIEFFLARPFIKRDNAVIIVLLTTLAASSFLDNFAQLIWGPRMKRLSPLVGGKIEILGTAISSNEFLIVILSPVLLLALWIVLKTTRVGIAIRGVEQNQRFAQLVGINVKFTYAITFGLGASMAATAGMFLGAKAFIVPTMGNEPMLKAFIVVILGGLGSLGGTIAGAYLVGFVEAISIYFLGLYWTPAILFLMMITVIVLRPTGLFGEN
jgi:branched-chain amino acid transport system permease protein